MPPTLAELAALASVLAVALLFFFATTCKRSGE